MGVVGLPSNRKGTARLTQLYGGDIEAMEREIAQVVAEPRFMNRWANANLDDGPEWGQGAEKMMLKKENVVRNLAVNYLICVMENSRSEDKA